MHPILSQRRALVFYIIVWMAIGAGIGSVIAMRGVLSWQGAVVLSIVMSVLLALIVLSSWYPCKAYPVDGTRVPIFTLVHLAAALVSSLLWLAAGEALVAAWSSVVQDAQASSRYHNGFPLLLGAGVVMYLLAASVHYVLLGIQAAKERERAALELEYLAREAELKALRAQIDPHFLFNSLNSLSALTTSDPLQARLMCLRLADFLRASLTLGSRGTIRFEEELSLFDGYLEIEKIRFGERLSVARDIDTAAQNAPVPSLLLQPLIENAVKHGITHLLDGGTVTLRTKRHNDRLMISLENPCDPQRPVTSGVRMGVELVRKRLSTQYGNAASLTVRDRGDSFVADIVIPIVESAG